MPLDSLTDRAVQSMIFLALDSAVPISWIDRLAWRVDSNQLEEEYNWLGMSPAMREWLGPRQEAQLRAQAWVILNHVFESSITVGRRHATMDKTGQIQQRINQLGRRAEEHWVKMVVELMIRAESTPCYDGQFFFDTDHQEGDSGVQSNDVSLDISAEPAQVTGTPAAPSPEIVRAMIFAGIQQIMGFKDDRGELLNETSMSFHVELPLPYMRPGYAAVGRQILAGDTNEAAGGVIDGLEITVRANPRLTWTDKLAVFRGDADAAPFILQNVGDPEPQVIGSGSEHEKKTDTHIYGVRAERGAGYGYWQHACLVTAT